MIESENLQERCDSLQYFPFAVPQKIRRYVQDLEPFTQLALGYFVDLDTMKTTYLVGDGHGCNASGFCELVEEKS